MNSLPPIPGPLAGSASLSGGGGAVVSSLTGTANQINVSAATGAVTVSLSSTIVTPGTLQVPNAGGSTTAFQVGSGSGASTGVYIGANPPSGFGGIWSTAITPSNVNYGIIFGANQTFIAGGGAVFGAVVIRPDGSSDKISFVSTAGQGPSITAGTATTNVNALSVTQVWNNAGVTFTALKANITDTTSASGSLLLDLQVGGSSVASLRKDGSLVAGGITGNTFVSSFQYLLSNGTRIRDSGDGILTLYNNAVTDFSRLQFGGTTSSFPAIRRKAADLQFRVADDSGYCNITAEGITAVGAVTANTSVSATTYVKTGTTTVAGLPSAATAGAGARYFVTDAAGGSWGTNVSGGGATKVPVYSDGTNWVIG